MFLFLTGTTTAFAQTADSTAQAAPSATATAPPAQVTAPESGAASILLKGVTGELLALNVPRSEMELQRLLDEARSLARLSDLEAKSRKDLAATAEGRASVMKQEMDATKAKRDVAKKAKDKAALAEIDAAYKRQEAEYKYLVQVRDAMRADMDRLQSAQGAATAQAKALELEIGLVQKQAALGDQPSPQAVAEFRGMLRGMLESQLAAAEKGREASDKRRKVVSERLKQLDALAKLGQ
jgi:hypothetical protein